MIGPLIRATQPLRTAVETWSFRKTGQPSRLARFANRHKGKPLVIVGNGPSLNRTPIGGLGRVPTIGMNKINMLFPRTSWRPTYIAANNGLVIWQNRDFFAHTNITTFLDWKGAPLFLPRPTRHYVLPTYRPGFSRDLAKGVAAGSTVTYTALHLAYHMGADPVILVGVDHTFGATPDATGRIERRQGDDQHHFDKNYFAAGSLWGLPDLAGSEAAYALARNAFEEDGRRVYDATVGGKLKVFDKLDLSELQEMLRHHDPTVDLFDPDAVPALADAEE